MSLEAQAQAAGWFRFKEVTEFVPDGQKLYRSSAPSYRRLGPGQDHDSSQILTQKAVDFLIKTGIDSIISFNKYAYDCDEIARLEKADPPIAYLHVCVQDFSPPTLQQLRDANAFFVGKKSTLVHCGYGHGRTGTGVTALQICTVNGQTLEPYASMWCGYAGGNHVEKRRQMSILTELRSVLLQNRSKGIPDVQPGQNFVIINFATGYYLTVSSDGKNIIALPPETVEHGPGFKRQYLWAIKKDKTASNLTISNCATSENLIFTKLSGAKVDDPVNNGTGEGGNTLFTMTEAAGNDRGLYIISPAPNPELAVAIKEPDNNFNVLYQSEEMPALLASRDENSKFGLWILLPSSATPE